MKIVTDILELRFFTWGPPIDEKILITDPFAILINSSFPSLQEFFLLRL